jgi:hypothetical protein
MPGIYKRGKLQSLPEVLSSVYDDLLEAGFATVFPLTGGELTFTADVGRFVVESTPTVNPVNENQPYRILMETMKSETGIAMRAAIANPQQIPDTGTGLSSFSYVRNDSDTEPYEGDKIMGQLGNKFSPAPYRAADVAKGTSAKPGMCPGDVFIARNGIRNTVIDSGSTMSYVLSVTDHGVVFYVWQDSTSNSYSFFCVQSPVNKETGEPLTDLNSPIFCVYDADNTGIKKFVVSEADTATPTVAVDADEDSVNSSAIINSQEQVAIKRGNKYLVTFPNRLNTDRYAYTEELDMLAYTSADVIGEETEIPVRIYGEVEDRLYRAMKSNGPNNTKMRLLVLVKGGGIPAV